MKFWKARRLVDKHVFRQDGCWSARLADHDVRDGEALAQQGSSFSQVAIEGRQQPLDLRSRFG